MTRIRGLIIAVTIIWLIFPASGQTIMNHVSHRMVSEVQSRFIKSFKRGGMMEVVQDIKACYAATTDQRSVSNEMAVASCLLYDYSAFQLNQGFVKALVAEGVPGVAAEPEPGSAMAYLTGSAFSARLDIYANIPFGTNTQAFGPYFGDAPKQIMQAVERSIR